MQKTPSKVLLLCCTLYTESKGASYLHNCVLKFTTTSVADINRLTVSRATEMLIRRDKLQRKTLQQLQMPSNEKEHSQNGWQDIPLSCLRITSLPSTDSAACERHPAIFSPSRSPSCDRLSNKAQQHVSYSKTLNAWVPFISRISQAKQNREIKGRKYQLQAQK